MSNHLKWSTVVYLMRDAAFTPDAYMSMPPLCEDAIASGRAYEQYNQLIRDIGVQRALWDAPAHMVHHSQSHGWWVFRAIKMVGILTAGLDQLDGMKRTGLASDPVFQVNKFCRAYLDNIMEHPDWYVLVKVIYYS